MGVSRITTFKWACDGWREARRSFAHSPRTLRPACRRSASRPHNRTAKNLMPHVTSDGRRSCPPQQSAAMSVTRFARLPLPAARRNGHRPAQFVTMRQGSHRPSMAVEGSNANFQQGQERQHQAVSVRICARSLGESRRDGEFGQVFFQSLTAARADPAGADRERMSAAQTAISWLEQGWRRRAATRHATPADPHLAGGSRRSTRPVATPIPLSTRRLRGDAPSLRVRRPRAGPAQVRGSDAAGARSADGYHSLCHRSTRRWRLPADVLHARAPPHSRRRAPGGRRDPVPRSHVRQGLVAATSTDACRCSSLLTQRAGQAAR